MALEKITSVSGRGVFIPGDDIDTDRIIPARFMKCITFDGLGEFLFYDARFDEHKQPKNFPLNDPRFQGASILLTGNNFGCGSSREHAPQAIYRAGFRAIIAEGYAEIFFGNSTTLGMPCITASKSDIRTIAALIEENPSAILTIDLSELVIRLGNHSWPCTLRETARKALISGQWDPIAELLEGQAEVDRVASRLGYMGTPVA